MNIWDFLQMDDDEHEVEQRIQKLISNVKMWF